MATAASPGAQQNRWNEAVSGPFDPTEQRNCYMAALHSLLGKPWFAGWFWREWTTDPYQGGTGDLSYSPKGKQAQEVLRRWFAGIGTERGACFPNCSDSLYMWPRTLMALESLAESHANWVGINARWIMQGIGDDYDTIEPIPGYSPTDTSLRVVIGWAHSLMHDGRPWLASL